jgi:hypothetical protein
MAADVFSNFLIHPFIFGKTKKKYIKNRANLCQAACGPHYV